MLPSKAGKWPVTAKILPWYAPGIMASLPVTWSNTPPREPGFFWFRSPASEPTLVRVRREDADGEWSVDFLEDGESEQNREAGVNDEWAGPLYPPA